MFKPISKLLRITTRSITITSTSTSRFQSRLPSIPTISSRPFLTSLPQFEPSPPHPALPPVTNSNSTTTTDPNAPIRTPIGKIQRRLQITFTCTATLDPEVIQGQEEVADLAEGVGETTCGHRSTHEFSKRSYDHGIVLIECPGCKNRHLIADNLSWFSQTPSPAHPKGLPIGSPESKVNRTVEDLMKEKGEKVKWLEGGANGGTWELEV